MQLMMVAEDVRCTCFQVPSRLGVELGKQIGMAIARRCERHPSATHPSDEAFEALQDLLSDLAVLEGGAMLFGISVRWFEALRFRCSAGHVHVSDDPQSLVFGNCPVCLAPVALTFPEDVDDPPSCQTLGHAYHGERDRMRAVLLGVLGARG